MDLLLEDFLYSHTEESLLDEGYLSQLTMGLKIKPHQDLEESIKKHQYPGLLNFAKNVKKKEDIEYLKRDLSTAVRTITKIKDRIDKVNKLGNCAETKNYYKGIKTKYIDKGITTKDCDSYLNWLNNDYKKVLNQK